MEDRTFTREIPRDAWTPWFAELAQRGQGAPVHVEADGPSIGEVDAGRHLPFAGIALEGQDVVIRVKPEGRELEHRIFAPKRVYARFTPGGGLECLDIEDREGTKFLVEFERLPELEPPPSVH